MQTQHHYFSCSRCDCEYINHHASLPNGWATDLSGDIICDDCAGLAESVSESIFDTCDRDERTSPPIAFTPADPSVEHFFAAYMPRRKRISLFFDSGNVDFTLSESEAIASCLSSANAIARGQHPAILGN